MAYTLKLNGDKVKGLSIRTNNGLQDVKTVKQGNDVLWEMEKVATPVISCSNNVVTMTCSTAGATIKYSTNGGSSYSTYSSAITISATTTYTVFAVKSGMLDSETTTYTATYKGTVAKPTVSCSNNVVTMSCSTSGATIKYSTNGGSSYSTYSSPITISSTTTYTVYATKSGMFDSATTTYKATYVKPKLAKATVKCTNITQDRITLTFTHSAGSGVTYYVNYGANSSISNPTTSSSGYMSKLTGSGSNSKSETYFQIQGSYKYIKVLATKSGYTNSDILSYKYTYPSTTPTTF